MTLLADDAIDETYGINVQFEESDVEDDEDLFGEIREEQEVDEEQVEEGVEADMRTTLTADVSRRDHVIRHDCAINMIVVPKK